MRWFVGLVLALLVGWGVYIVSPYWALRQLATAIETGNVAELERRVNFRALRHSVTRQVATELAAADRTGTLSARDAQLAIGAVTAAAEPLVEQMLTGRGLVALLRRAPDTGGDADERPPFHAAAPSRDRIAELLSASSWRGFRNVYFTLPPGAPREGRYRLQLRLGRLQWRLVSVELPVDMRRRFMRTLVERRVRAAP